MTIQLEGYDEPLDGFHFRDEDGQHVFVRASEVESARDADALIDACQAIAEQRLAARLQREQAQRTERDQRRAVPLESIRSAVSARTQFERDDEAR